MNRLALLSLATAAVGGCQPDTRNIDKKLDAIQAKLDSLEKKVGAGGGAGAGAQRPSRPEPDRAKTYAVPIDGDPFVGPADAKITLVEAYDYG